MDLKKDIEYAATIIITLLLNKGDKGILEVDREVLYEEFEGETYNVYEWVLMLLDGAKKYDGTILDYLENLGIAIRWTAKIK